MVSGITASRIDSDPYHSAGSASIAPTGTTQRWLRGAPQAMSSTPIGPRTSSGIGTAAHVPPLPVFEASSETQSRHASGINAIDTRAMAAVAPSAIASCRHSRRSTNHSSPTPGVIFVSSTSAHVHGQRNPATIATASTSDTLPPAISMAPTTSPSSNSSGPVSTNTAAIRIAVHTPTNAGHGSRSSG